MAELGDSSGVVRELRDVAAAARETLVSLREVNSLTGGSGSSTITGGMGPSASGAGHGSETTRSIQLREAGAGRGGGKFKDVREAGNLVQDIVSGDYASAITNVTKEVAKKLGVRRGGIGAGVAVLAATSAIQTAFEAYDEAKKFKTGQQEVANSLNTLYQEFGGRRNSAKIAEELIQKQVEKDIAAMPKGTLDGGFQKYAGSKNSFARDYMQGVAWFASKITLGIIGEPTKMSELRAKAAATIEKNAAKTADLLKGGYEAIALGNVINGAKMLQEANTFDPNVGKMWANPAALYTAVDSARIAGRIYASTLMRRAGSRYGD